MARECLCAPTLRRLRNVCLAYLSKLGDQERALTQFRKAACMTESMAAVRSFSIAEQPPLECKLIRERVTHLKCHRLTLSSSDD